MTGEIFDIKKFAVHDGPGIRTTFFMKGCPLSCVWCHNPEGMRPGKDIWVKQKTCIHCQTCVHVCPRDAVNLDPADGEIKIDKGLCDFCDICVGKCPTTSMQRIDRKVTAEELLQIAKADQVFFESSGGGITISGGEPLGQAPFVKEVLKLMQENHIHTCIETSMFAGTKTFAEIVPYVDQFLVDIKLWDEELHKKYCGVSNRQILENFRYLVSQKKPVLVRIPLIPGITATRENLTAIRAFVDALDPGIEIEALNYNDFAGSKYKFLERVYFDDEIRAFKKPDYEELCELVKRKI